MRLPSVLPNRDETHVFPMALRLQKVRRFLDDPFYGLRVADDAALAMDDVQKVITRP